MRIAICFNGMIRTGVHASENIKRYIGDLYPYVDFFMHTWDITENKAWHEHSLMSRKFAPKTYIPTSSYNLIKDLVSAYDSKFVSIKIDNYNLWKAHFLKTYTEFSPQWYSWHESIKLKSSNEIRLSRKYDVVIRLRPDLIYPVSNNLNNEIEHFRENPDLFYAMNHTEIMTDDVFFLSNSETMDRASKFITNPGTHHWYKNIFGEYLKNSGIKTKITKSSMYAVLREEAVHMKIDVNNFNRCFNLDRDYHAPYNVLERLPDE